MNGSKRPGHREPSVKYFGKYRGTVVNNDDPKKLGRLRANVPELLDEEITDWALPCMPYGGTPRQGMFMVPEVGAQVWIEFEAGDISHPIWVGTFWKKAWDQEPTIRMIQTKSGHVLRFDDEEGKEDIRFLHSAGAGIRIDANGSISLIDESGARFKLNAYKEEITLKDAHGNKIELSDSGIIAENKFGNVIEMADGKISLEAPTILLKGNVHLGDEGGEPIIEGLSFINKYAKHIHTVAPVVGGPTSPPIPQGEIATLSTSVKTK